MSRFYSVASGCLGAMQTELASHSCMHQHLSQMLGGGACCPASYELWLALLL